MTATRKQRAASWSHSRLSNGPSAAQMGPPKSRTFPNHSNTRYSNQHECISNQLHSSEQDVNGLASWPPCEATHSAKKPRLAACKLLLATSCRFDAVKIKQFSARTANDSSHGSPTPAECTIDHERLGGSQENASGYSLGSMWRASTGYVQLDRKTLRKQLGQVNKQQASERKARTGLAHEKSNPY